MKKFLSVALIALLWACGPGEKLPYLGEPETVTKTVNGKEVTEQTYPTIPPFQFTNQDGKTVTERDLAGKIYVADFFFATCPTICPVMSRNLKLVWDAYKDAPDVRLVSHTIDPDHDTPAVLKTYAQDLGVTGQNWQFLTGDREKIYEIGEKHYLVTAGKDSTAPGGYIHSGAFVLIDKERHIRGMYDGTKKEDVDKLIADIKILQAE